MKLNQIIEMDKSYFMNTFGSRVPVSFEYGKGIHLWDTEGKKYTDFFAGVAVSALGHSHPSIIKAISQQAEKLIHCSNHYYIETQAKLAKVLAQNSCADKVFFANSGAEVNDGAYKLVRAYFNKQGQSHKYEIITLQNSFHGRTLASTAATGQEKYQKPFYPMPAGFVKAPINDMNALLEVVSDATAAIMLEPIQGESGVFPVTLEYMKSVKKLCEDKGILLVFDEVQTGLGRTGKLFAYEHYGVEPDIFTLAKALGGGLPIAALCAKEFVAKAFEPGDHGSTYGGNPLVCAVALSVMDEILNGGLTKNAAELGSYFMDELEKLKAKYSFITEVRGKGLMIGIELSISKAKDIKDKCFEKGYLIGNIGANIFRVLPPLIVTKEDIDGMIDTFDSVFAEFNI